MPVEWFENPENILLLFGLGGLLIGLILGVVFASLTLGKRKLAQAQTAAKRDVEKIIQTERKRLGAIYALISALTATLSYRRVLDTALDLSVDALGARGPADRLVSAVLLFSHDENGEPHLTVGSARRFTPADMRVSLAGVSGLIAKTIEEGEPTFSKEIRRDSELSRVVALRACNAAYCIPLQNGLDRYGVILFAHQDADFFTSGHRDILEMIGNQTSTAIQNAKLYHELEVEKQRMADIQEEARKKLARDLHDGPTQSIAAIAMRVNFARRLMERDAKAGSEELFKIEELARRTTKEIRHMLFTLRPLILETQGLIAALETMAEKMKDTYNQNVIVEGDDKVIAQLEMGKQAVIFYIAEEAVNNARKHAQASAIWVRIKSFEKEVALLEIEDNGVGFDVGAVDSSYEQRGSLGMVNMRERTELINGLFRIDSTERKGTRIQVFIPLSEDASDKLRRG
jgi:signal transduction histidine kinase